MPVTRNQANTANAAKASSENPDTSASKEVPDKDETTTEAEEHRRESPDNCSICLGPFNNKSFTSSCAHSFCFVCLKQWSKVKAECPLCKQPFTSIFHNIRSDQSYDIYELPPLNPPRQNDYNFLSYLPRSITAYAAPTHYFSLTQPGLDADLTLSNFSRFQFRRRYDRYLQPHHPVHGEHQYSYTGTSFTHLHHVCASSWPRGAEDFRREVYRRSLGPPLIILGTENSTYRLTPAMVAASPHRMQRIMPWLTRELKVLVKSHHNVRLAISVIQPLLTQVTIDSTTFSDKVSPLIGRRSRQFIQEFVAFTNSALLMQAYDRKAMYQRHDATISFDENTSSSSSDDDDDVVEITDVSSDTEITGRTSPVAGSSRLLRTGWDSPTPGPSWESIDLSSVRQPIETDTVSVSSESDDPVFRPDQNDSDSSSKAGSDIVFLKYDKPWTERSPIQLSSDSEGESRKKRKSKSKHKKKKKEQLESLARAGENNKSPGRSRSADKSRSKTATVVCDDIQAPVTADPARKKRMLSTSSEKQKKKKKKKSKDRDRELVDRYFAESIGQQLGAAAIPATIAEVIEGPSSSKATDPQSKPSRSERGKHKHKKKDKNRSSQSPSLLQSYKKHHSGHKKTSESFGRSQLPDAERRKHKSKYSSRAEPVSDQSVEGESSVWETHRAQPIPAQNIGHSLSSSFPSNYIAMPDNLQPIPLNLWVSPWPALPSTHTFPAPPPPPPPSFLPSLPHSSSMSNSALDSHTVISESSSETDSDDTEDYELSSAPSTTASRTKQWLEANFPDQGKLPSTSTGNPQPRTGSSLRSWNDEPRQSTAGNFNDNVVSILSDDEDVVVCSSVSTKSDPDEIKFIEPADFNIRNRSSGGAKAPEGSETFYLPPRTETVVSTCQSIFPVTKSYDPVLSFSSSLLALPSSSQFTNEDRNKPYSAESLFTCRTDTQNMSVNGATSEKVPTTESGSPGTISPNKDAAHVTSSSGILSDLSNGFMNGSSVMSKDSMGSSPSTSDSIFGIKSSLNVPVPPIAPLLSSSVTYLPCPSTSLSSILTHPLPFGVSQPPPPDVLPMHLMLHTVPSLLPSPLLYSHIFHPDVTAPSTTAASRNCRSSEFSCASILDEGKKKDKNVTFGVEDLLGKEQGSESNENKVPSDHSQTALGVLDNSQNALSAWDHSQTDLGSLDNVAECRFLDMLNDSPSAMDTLDDSQTAFDKSNDSPSAMDTLEDSQTAMDKLNDSPVPFSTSPDSQAAPVSSAVSESSALTEDKQTVEDGPSSGTHSVSDLKEDLSSSASGEGDSPSGSIEPGSSTEDPTTVKDTCTQSGGCLDVTGCSVYK
ncbi:uncharacterized protein LOC131942609 [Physella acuta]|uniref:uncharacterized protein LOC131942609 n=1 Tax=Physella acuta TaxID=109671 RepID=UPI0027DDCA49|nr:uncharacterized protein LOC131942609 [Physella acuta]